MIQDTRKLACGSFLRTFNLFATIAVSFFLMPFMIHSLGDRMYGFWSLICNLIGYYGLMEFGLSSAVERYVAKAIGAQDQKEYNQILNTGIFIFSGLGFTILLTTGILAGLAPLFCKTSEDISLFGKIILILGLNLAFDFPIKAFYGILSAQLRYDIMAAVSFLSLVLRTILIIFALNAGHKILGLAWVTFLSGIPEKILIIYFGKKCLPSLQLSRKHLKRKAAKILFSYSIFKFISQIADQLRFNIDALVITAYIDLTAVTHYSIASRLTTYFITIITGSMGVIKPVFSRQEGANDLEAIKKTFFFVTKISIFLSSFIGFGLIIWGKPFIHRWMGFKYLDAYPCLVTLTMGCIFALWQTPSISLLYALSKHHFLTIFNSIEALCNLLLSIYLVRHLGILGVAIGTFVPMAITKLIIQPIYVCNACSILYADYMQCMVSTIIKALIFLAIPLFISLRFGMPNYFILTTLGAVSAILYISSIWFWGFEPKERLIIRKAIMPNLSICLPYVSRKGNVKV